MYCLIDLGLLLREKSRKGGGGSLIDHEMHEQLPLQQLAYSEETKSIFDLSWSNYRSAVPSVDYSLANLRVFRGLIARSSYSGGPISLSATWALASTLG